MSGTHRVLGSIIPGISSMTPMTVDKTPYMRYRIRCPFETVFFLLFNVSVTLHNLGHCALARNSVRFSNLDETVTTMFPLIQPAIEEIAEQIYDSQSLDDISLPEDTPYTSRIILDAVREAVEKAEVR